MQRFRVRSDVGSRRGTDERDRRLGGRDQGVAEETAAAAAQDAARQAGSPGRDHAACAQRQSGGVGGRVAA